MTINKEAQEAPKAPRFPKAEYETPAPVAQPAPRTAPMNPVLKKRFPKAEYENGRTPSNTQQWQGQRQGAPASSGNKDIKLMQQEIINFHNDLKDVAYDQKDQKDFRKGADPFLKYMLDNYSKQSPSTVTQYTTDNPQSASPTGRSGLADSYRGQDAWGMKQMLASLDKVGKHSANGETHPDGHWGILTNRALQNVAAFSWSMVQLAQDVKLPNPSWTQAEQDEFKKMIPPDPETDSQVADTSNAPKITEGVHKIIQLWKSFYTQIFSPSGQYGKEVGQTVGFSAATINPSKYSIKEDMSNIINQNKDNPLYPKDNAGNLINPGARLNQIYNNVIGKISSNLSSDDAVNDELRSGKVQSRQVNVSIKDLSSLNNFQAFLKANNVRFNNKSALTDLPGAISKIREKLGVQ